MVKICPRCQTRYTIARHNGDFVHECNSGNLTLDEEDVFKLGDYVDYTGSGTQLGWNYQAIENDKQGTRAGIEKAKPNERVTRRGKNSKLFRQRKHLEYIPTENGC